MINVVYRLSWMFSIVFLLPCWFLNFLPKPMKRNHGVLFCEKKSMLWITICNNPWEEVLCVSRRNKISTFRLNILTRHSDDTSGCAGIFYHYVVILDNRQNRSALKLHELSSKNALFHTFAMKPVKMCIGSHQKLHFLKNYLSLLSLSFSSPGGFEWWLLWCGYNSKLCHEVKWTWMVGRHILSKACRLKIIYSTQVLKLRKDKNKWSQWHWNLIDLCLAYFR